jgi:hypothetical protein
MLLSIQFCFTYISLIVMEEGSEKRSKIFLSGFHGSKKTDERHIEFRSDGVPICDNESKFVNYFALLVREQVPCKLKEGQCKAKN